MMIRDSGLLFVSHPVYRQHFKRQYTRTHTHTQL